MDRNISLTKLTDKQLKDRIDEKIVNVQYSANDYYGELDRRSHNRWTRWITIATIINAVAAIISAIVACIAISK